MVPCLARRRGALVAGLLAACLAAPLWADPTDLCFDAARRAAAESGVPLAVLTAISQTETGRSRDGQVRPWPWTVNMEGEGRWFDSRDAALAWVHQHYRAGARSFDMGCFQINYRWHGQNFASIEQMFDPLAGARYAARFLSDLHRETGDWSEAAGAYHSRTPEHAQRYRARFDRFRAAGAGESGQTTVAAASNETVIAAADPAAPFLARGGGAALPRENSFPLLRGGGTPIGRGSLVPLSNGG